jgi:hypothetical protein
VCAKAGTPDDAGGRRLGGQRHDGEISATGRHISTVAPRDHASDGAAIVPAQRRGTAGQGGEVGRGLNSVLRCDDKTHLDEGRRKQ